MNGLKVYHLLEQPSKTIATKWGSHEEEILEVSPRFL